MDNTLGTNPIARFNQWQSQQNADVGKPPGTDYQTELDTFNRHFDNVSKADGAPTIVSLYGSPGDIDKKPGSVNIPGSASLQKTAEGFQLTVLGHGMHGGLAGWCSYSVNEADQTVHVTKSRAPYSFGTGMVPGKTESFEMDLQSQTLSNYEVAGYLMLPPQSGS